MRALKVPFNLTGNGRVREADGYGDIVRGQIIDALMTNQGERVMRPRYGCDVQAALFDPVDELVRRDAASQIKARLESTVSRALVRSVTIEQANEPSMVIVTVSYRPSLYSTDTQLSVPVASEFLRRQLEREIS